MIPIAKLAKLSPRHRLRKAALVLGEVERRLMARPGEADAEGLRRYARGLAELLAGDAAYPPSLIRAAGALRDVGVAAVPRRLDQESPVTGIDANEPELLLRALDTLRHELIVQSGQAPADWDLIDPTTGRPDAGARRVQAGVRAYLEDLRSPFNVGAIFRTAEAFGFEELVLSADCADPRHPRAERSAMGAVDLVPWRRAELARFFEDRTGEDGGGGAEGVFALELGGTPIGEFRFPPRGLVVIGSEELGISPAARKLCGDNIVSIPMRGAKGSLNAAVAFGIVAQAWVAALDMPSS